MGAFRLRFIPETTRLDFIGKKWIALTFSMVLTVASIVLILAKGFNFGIDFTGGILMEVRFPTAPNVGEVRTLLSDMKVGDVSLQTLGNDETLLIRVGQSGDDADKSAQVVNQIKETLSAHTDGAIDYRKAEYVGPKVGRELIISGATATILAFAAIMLYMWIRFEWQYGAGVILALLHDTIMTLGFFSLTQLEFNLSSLAAILTIIGYSVNDSVVIYDRIRELFRKYKRKPIEDVLNLSLNSTLSRTVVTSVTTLVAVLALALFGGETIRSFSYAALFGIAIGTYSSIYISAPTLIFMRLRSDANRS